MPSTFFLAGEVEWYEHDKHRVIGVLILDLVDEDWGGIVMGLEEGRLFRCVEVAGFF